MKIDKYLDKINGVLDNKVLAMELVKQVGYKVDRELQIVLQTASVFVTVDALPVVYLLSS